MKIIPFNTWSQNLNEPNGSKLWHGRGHIAGERIKVGAEWLFLHRVKWSCGVSFMLGGHRSAMFHLSVPWLLSVYLHLDGIQMNTQGRRFHFGFHHNSVWLSIWSKEMETDARDPWWVRGVSWSLPWERTWVHTRILSHDGKQIVWEETCRKRKDFFKTYEDRKRIEASVSKDYYYHYTLKNGEVQKRTATVHLEERAYGFKWWKRPLFIFRAIAVEFDQEVGEGSGSYKGGVTGCGYDLLSGETAESCLRRMEADKEFNR